MGLDLNYSNNLNSQQSNAEIWDNLETNILKEFCLINNLGSITAFKIKFDYYLNFKMQAAEKYLDLLASFYRNVGIDKYEQASLFFQTMREKIEDKKSAKENNINKINLNSFKVQSNKKEKLDIINSKKGQIDMNL